MLEFQKPALSDQQWVTKIMRASGELACEYCFGNLYMWSSVYDNTIAEYNGLFLARDGSESPMYLFPCGEGDKKGAIEELMRCAKADGAPLTLYCLTPKKVRELDCLMPDKFEYIPMREYFDYIYNTEDLISLAGRKYHGKRNHISYFKKNFDWRYKPLTEKNMDACLKMNDLWEKENQEKNPEGIGNELIAIRCGFVYRVLYLRRRNRRGLSRQRADAHFARIRRGNGNRTRYGFFVSRSRVRTLVSILCALRFSNGF